MGAKLVGTSIGNAAAGPLGAVAGYGAGNLASTGNWGRAMGTVAGDHPSLAPIQQGTDIGDVQNAQKGATQSLEAQNNLLAALQGQNGLGAQSNLMNQMAASNGIGAQNQALAGLGNAAGMYGQIAQGQGPNPAQAMLNQQTGQNVANQAALMAGQRGAGANAGLLARQAAQQGAGIQQQAVGQGATMQAQQQLNAIQGLTGANQAIGGLGSQQVGQTAGMANQLAGQQIGQVNANTQANLMNQQQMQGALAGINQANVANQASVNAGNTALANTALQGKQGLIGGLMNSTGAGLASLGAEGGQVVRRAFGSPMPESQAPMAAEGSGEAPLSQPAAGNQPSSDWGKYLTAAMPMMTANANSQDKAVLGFVQKAIDPKEKQSSMAEGGNAEFDSTPDLSSSGDASPDWGKYTNEAGSISGEPAKKDSELGEIAEVAALFAAEGGLANGGGNVNAKSDEQKAVATGNSYSNDKIPAKLSEGEIVLPRSVTMSDDPIAAASKFVAETLAKRGKKTPGNNYADKPELVASDDSALPPANPQAPDMMSREKPDILSQNGAPQGAAQANIPPPDESYVGSNPEDKAQELHNRNLDASGKQISPKTWGQLWTDKSVPGKIASIFGLMMSGAGSGLSKQPNAAIEMMNKIVENDLEAQKASQEGARNFISVESDIANKNATTAETRQKVFKQSLVNDMDIQYQADLMRNRNVPEERVKEWELEQHRRNQETYAPIMGKLTALGSISHDLKNTYGNLPQAQGPLAEWDAHLERKSQQELSRGKAINQINTQKSANEVIAKNEAGNDQVLNQDLWQSGQKFGRMSGMTDDRAAQQNLANINPKTGKLYPGRKWIIEPSDIPKINAEKTALTSLRNDRKLFNEVSGALGKIPFGGESEMGLITDFLKNPQAKAGGAVVDRVISPERQAKIAELVTKYPELLPLLPGLATAGDNKRKSEMLQRGNALFDRKEVDEFPTINKYPDLISPVKRAKISGNKNVDITTPFKASKMGEEKAKAEPEPTEGISGLINKGMHKLEEKFGSKKAGKD